MLFRTVLLSITLLLTVMSSSSSGHWVKVNDTFTIEDTNLFIKSPIINSILPTPKPTIANRLVTIIRNLFNPVYWLQKIFELIPETAFWLLGVNNYDCRYLTICQTSNYIINNAPKFLSSMFRGSHTGVLSTILGETPYIEAWSIGSIKSIDCTPLYNCSEPPFNL